LFPPGKSVGFRKLICQHRDRILTVAKRVLIAEDHPAMREGLRRVIEKDGDMVVVGAAENGAQAVQLHKELQPDVTLIDLQMPKLDGLGAVAAIRQISPAARFVVLTSYAGDARVRRALDSGVSSFLLKTSHSTLLLSALRAALQGKSMIDPGIEASCQLPGTKLTTREISVLKCVAEGDSNARIGVRLRITEHAVKARIKKILLKLVAQDRAHAVTIARQRGFIDC
jgi:DNA-binding NarL/FixJ family response regulator